jgi:hypothetical protein
MKTRKTQKTLIVERNWEGGETHTKFTRRTQDTTDTDRHGHKDRTTHTVKRDPEEHRETTAWTRYQARK